MLRSESGNDGLHRGEQFREVARRLFGNIRQRFIGGQEPGDDQLFHAALGRCGLSRITAGAHGVCGRRTAKHSFDPDSIKVLVQMQGRVWFDQDTGKIPLEPDHAIIYDPTHPYFLLNRTRIEQLVLQVPRSFFDDRSLQRLKRPIVIPPVGHAQSHTLTSFIRTASSNCEGLTSEMRSIVGQSLAVFTSGLVSESFRLENLQMMDNASLILLRERVKAFVRSNLGDSDLTLERIASRMGCSVRYLHRAFEREQMSLQRFIWSERLEASRDMLIAAIRPRRSILEISLECGFSSSAHFSRMFKQRFGFAPSEVQANCRV